MFVQEDLYPSRIQDDVAFLERTDPVVYEGGPVSQRLTPEDLRQYENSGYLFPEGLLQAEEISSLTDEFRRLARAPDLRESEELITEPDSDEVRLYYGAADSSICLATAQLRDLLDAILDTPPEA